MNMKFQLAESNWPRSGCDRGNRSHASIAGPQYGAIALEVKLPRPRRKTTFRSQGGCVITERGILLVMLNGVLSAVTLNGKILWSYHLKEKNGKLSTYCSLPVALHSGQSLITLGESVLLIDQQGNRLEQIRVDESLDDSGPSPNITNSHHLILTSVTGQVSCFNANHLSEIGHFGFDILPPAVYDDDSLAISGYGNTGFCRVRLDGQKVWVTDLLNADQLPTVNCQQVAAVGSINDGSSAFVSPEGVIIGSYRRASVFAEYSRTEWIALSEVNLAKLTLEGEQIWERPIQPRQSIRGVCQPIVDEAGCIFVSDGNDLLSLDTCGHLIFSVTLPEPLKGGLSLVSPGCLACISNDKLYLIQ